MLLFFRNDTGFGGNNGFTDFKRILGIPITTPRNAHGAVRDHRRGADRHAAARALHRHVEASAACSRRSATPRRASCSAATTRCTTSCSSGRCRRCCAASPGALYVPQVGIINPSEMSPGELDRDRDLGGGRRPRHADRADRRRGAREWREERFHPGPFPEYWLYVLGLHVHPGDAVPAARACFGLCSRARKGGRMSASRRMRCPESSAEFARVGGAPGVRRARCHARRRPVSRRHHGQLRRLQGAEQAVACHRRRRAALRDRPQRRRQDHDDGRDHRQDAARTQAPRSSARPSI